MSSKKEKKDISDAAKAMSALGASKGGKARANTMTPEERRENARKAAAARWGKSDQREDQTKQKGDEMDTAEQARTVEETVTVEECPVATYSMFRGTLKIGDVEMECHVLNDGRRVLTQREVVRVLSGGRESGNIQRYLERNPLTANDFELGPTIGFSIPGTGLNAIGYEATLLVVICDKYLQARAQKLLKPSQLKLAVQAEIVMRSCAKVGIIALIDEATGYDKVKARRDYQIKLQAFIAEDMQEWARMFPEEFWLQLARLEGVHYSPRSRPLRWGKYVMMFVYDAVDSDVGKELRKKNPNPHFLQNHHQWLKKFGREQVHDQIVGVIAVMKLCRDMVDFRTKFAQVFSKASPGPLFDNIDWNVDR